ncbi:hypothetical protein [Chryseobacterium sp. JUb7]|uniref:hypothetical protein n=1 Tax=Chryseobacterium sp. JUb7 TaxID=2940599 RepID=UPI00216A0516|nr:hypothetical protein [Chryseobacterium sp. JUb7]MCS3531419.1 hypothetical protein [Chryseobacterium sp. JUb7]
MKKIIYSLSMLCGVFAFSQSKVLTINNYSQFKLEGRLMAANSAPTITNPVVYAAPNAPYGVYTVPPFLTDIEYKTLSTSGYSILPIDTWYVTDPTYGGSYAFNNPVMDTVSSMVEWGRFDFVAKDNAGNPVDGFAMGEPFTGAVYYTLGTHSEADWFTIGDYTYLQVYDYP